MLAADSQQESIHKNKTIRMRKNRCVKRKRRMLRLKEFSTVERERGGAVTFNAECCLRTVPYNAFRLVERTEKVRNACFQLFYSNKTEKKERVSSNQNSLRRDSDRNGNALNLLET